MLDAVEDGVARGDFLLRVLAWRHGNDERVAALHGLEALLRERYAEVLAPGAPHECVKFARGVRQVFDAARAGRTDGARVVACALLLSALVLEGSFRSYLAPPAVRTDDDDDADDDNMTAARVNASALHEFETCALLPLFNDLLDGADMTLARFVNECVFRYRAAFAPVAAAEPPPPP